jgi:hypothetical protein
VRLGVDRLPEECYLTTKHAGKTQHTHLSPVSPQHSLHTAEADAVALDQRTTRRARSAVLKMLEDDLLAKAINQPPTTRCLPRSGSAAVVAIDPRGELAD